MIPPMFQRGATVLAFFALGFSSPSEAGAVQITAFQQAVAESVSRDGEIAEFYRDRGFAPIWTGESPADLQRRTVLIEALSLARHHGLPVEKYRIEPLLARMASVRSGYARGRMEVALTELYLDFARDMNTGVIDTPRNVRREIVRDIPKRGAGYYLEGLLSDTPGTFIATLAPRSQEYARLMKARMRLERTVARGGWGATVPEGKFEPGDAGSGVIILRERLIAMGYLERSVSARYDAEMTDAVKAFQESHGLAVDGVVGPSTRSALNVSALDRLKSVMVAMERERWLNKPDGLGERHVLVNITDFSARLYDEGKLTFETRSVVGHQDQDRQTPEFSDEMTHMVINPSWYVPRSIVVGEYLPKLRRNPRAVGHIEITDRRGRVVSRNRSFAGYTAKTFPFSMRQKPGPRNALGTVKFMFPNKYNIYLHDTPSKSLFDRTVRAFSHGCVRLSDPHDFAYTLLARQTADPAGEFNRILRTGRETRVNLDTPVPVHLIYRTAFTTPKGEVRFRPDIYGRDAAIWNALEGEGVEIGGIRS
ncbi:L,D-transpeptidase family protein [Marivita sp. GX14005]|uniref:L,D-transpeptidase family protein n=1 Tax=Marivita sp. GX14005 TaxID=2942276 RepID=UPI00201945E5|nr:L,D-transpeptidase family protein [Marivita sp. GX14005]MCL3882447.1 L,D-transpeptidase family protein [Marivita sp. GX14005]